MSISPASVLRDLARGERVYRKWAPEAVRELASRGLVVVSPGKGVVRLPGDPARTKRQRDALRKRKGREPHHKARERDRLALAMLPAPVVDVAEALGITVGGAKVVLARLRAVVAGEVRRPDARGVVRPVPVWGLP